MTEKRFNRVGGYVYDGDKCISHFEDVAHRDDIVKLLNELHEENEQLKTQLQNTSDQRDEFHRGARENANRVGKLEKENKQLKQEVDMLSCELSVSANKTISKDCRIQELVKENEQLKKQIGNLEHTRDFADEVCADYERLEHENEQLKEEKEKWKNNCSLAISENSILWNEINILREQGAEPSEAFNNYLNKKRSI